MAIRVDKTLTPSKKVDTFFSDFMNNFNSHPNGGMLIKLTNEDAVKQSLKNLILTNYGERFFQPWIGGNVNSSLFEMADGISADFLKDSISNTIKNNEKRVVKHEIIINAKPDDNAFTVTIYFVTNNSSQVQSLELTIKRLR